MLGKDQEMGGMQSKRLLANEFRVSVKAETEGGGSQTQTQTHLVSLHSFKNKTPLTSP